MGKSTMHTNIDSKATPVPHNGLRVKKRKPRKMITEEESNNFVDSLIKAFEEKEVTKKP